MTSRFSDRRPPRVRPLRDRDTDTQPPEAPLPELPSSPPDEDIEAAESRPPTRLEASMDLAERRRRKRLQLATETAELPPAVVPRGEPFRVYVSTRWFSASIAAICALMLFLFLSNPAFVISQIFVGYTGTNIFLTPPEIFQRSGLANQHVFWVDPAAVAQQLKRDPSIADVRIEVGWPPNMVQITVSERAPALIWEQAGQRVWLDINGRVMALRQDIPDLLRVIVERPSRTIHLGQCLLQGTEELLGPGSCIDRETVTGALQFKSLYPDVREIVYDPIKGLGFRDGRGWMLWFGDGTYIDVKMLVYNQIIETYYVQQGVQFVEVNVSNPDAAYFSVAPGSR